MYLLTYDLIVRLVCLGMGVVGLSLAWEFGLWSGERKDCLSGKMVNLFVAIAWAGFIIFIGGAIKIVLAQFNLHEGIDDARVVTVRLIAFAPILWALYQFRRFIVKTNQARFSVDVHRSNGKA